MRRHSRLVTAPVRKSIRLLFLVVTLSLPPLLFVIVFHSLLVRLEHNKERLKRMDNLSPTVIVKDPNTLPQTKPNFRYHRSNHAVAPWRESKVIPRWMKEYFQWHDNVLRNLTSENWHEHEYLIVRCLDIDTKCGGTAD